MGFLADQTGIQFRLLNTSKGPAVRGTRVQCDKQAYRLAMKAHLEQPTAPPYPGSHGGSPPGGRWLRSGCDGILRSLLSGQSRSDYHRHLFKRSHPYRSASDSRRPGRRVRLHHPGKSPAGPGFPDGAAKNRHSSPAARRAASISAPWPDYRVLIRSVPFPGAPQTSSRPQVSCYVTHTTADTHRWVRENIHHSPLYSGVIKGISARYCPSLEDKVMRFADKPSHQVTLEPEGLNYSGDLRQRLGQLSARGNPVAALPQRPRTGGG